MRVRNNVPRQRTDTLQLAVRVPRAWLGRLDALISKLAPPGFQPTRTDIIRAALSEGLDVLEARYLSPDSEDPPKKGRKPRPS